MDLTLRIVGYVRSPLSDRETAPRFETENAPPAEIVLDPAYRTAAGSLEAGQEILLFTWLHQADRSCQEVHPRCDTSRPLTGVFSTRSPDRPNPIGLHQVRLTAIDGDVLAVAYLEAIDGTPVIDIKPLADRGGKG
ncbi:MAG: tRNA (N6-threonylcarbamoyladenosine(37)-N6)-methyltransferase TrmO [Solidesulfovibrio sp.]|jgi:tRNA-Thr(GGU) m(6)t(6)A37 methyltransferase TsaA|uniref:tRNA (N6-threonylcarbamoyladenosine(37)-N6)-methyltransferase TrmO n=1 Tax=Solidesulfovibrio sp. TaxID=2910990 RepID=UPI002B1E936B|nr:tRNA (N6-threonylcarbamoyladenosine(37)-N6)-methyltransferase TrmO [Solidesulfovibrio sp.]MEA4858433.1 tRNA (N6-threonylcarbamoyladenosine(37)-N6)-methyltransferase TrmO [Solidesulfovibrio sp.]